MGNIWSFAAAAIIGGAIIYQRPLSNMLINLAQKAGQQTSLPSTPTAIDKAPFSGPTNDPNPSASSPSPSPTTPSPTVAKGGTDRFDVTHFYPDSPTGVKWYMTSYQTPNGPFEGKVAASGDITNGCTGQIMPKCIWISGVILQFAITTTLMQIQQWYSYCRRDTCTHHRIGRTWK
jgi:hypothetical protein